MKKSKNGEKELFLSIIIIGKKIEKSLIVVENYTGHVFDSIKLLVILM